MAKTLQRDVDQNKYEEKKILKHEDVEEVCAENRCRKIKGKKKSFEED